MNLNNKLSKLKKLICQNQKGASSKDNLGIKISDVDNVRLLSALYTFNHGDNVCLPFEYSCNAGNKSNGGGDFLKFEQELLSLGYKIENVVFVKKNYKLMKDAEAFEERKKNKQYIPSEIEYFVLSNEKGEMFQFRETPYTLEFLANHGDPRAIGTYENWVQKVKFGSVRHEYNSNQISGKKR